MKRIMYATAFVLAHSAGAAAAHAQQPSPGAFTLGDAIRAALATHPAVTSANAAVERAHSAVREAQSARLPGLFLDAAGIRFEKAMVVAPLHGFDPTTPPEFDKTLLQGTLSAAYTLFDNGARGARIDRAEALEDAASRGADAARSALIAETAVAYTSVIAGRELVAAHAERLGAMRAERDRARLMFAEGKVARVAVLRADAALAGARADSVQAYGDLQTAERSLARTTRRDADDISRAALTPPSAAAPAFDRNQILARARSTNPDLLRLASQIDAARELRTEARSVRLPKLQLGARLGEYASSNGFASSEWQTGVQLSYPVFTGGSTSAASQRAQAELNIATAELDVASLRIATAIDRAIGAAEAARTRVTALGDAVELQREVVRIEKLALDAGTGVQTDYFNAEAELLRLRAAATSARALDTQARVEIARLSGELSPDWITINLERTP